MSYLVGANGAGKSNFIDALHLVSDALLGSLDNALNERSGLNEVRRRSGGHPHHFGIRLDFMLRSGQRGYCAFSVGSLSAGGYEVRTEECSIGAKAKGPSFQLERGKVKRTSETTFPALTADRLALVSASGLEAFRPVYDALTSMGFYNVNPKLVRELQKPQDGRLMRPSGENIVSVIGHLERNAPESMALICRYLQSVVPTVHGVERKQVGPMESLLFRQDVPGSKHPWELNGCRAAWWTANTMKRPTSRHSPHSWTSKQPAAAVDRSARCAPIGRASPLKKQNSAQPRSG